MWGTDIFREFRLCPILLESLALTILRRTVYWPLGTWEENVYLQYKTNLIYQADVCGSDDTLFGVRSQRWHELLENPQLIRFTVNYSVKQCHSFRQFLAQNCALRAFILRIPDTSLRWFRIHSFGHFLAQNCAMLRAFTARIPDTSLRWCRIHSFRQFLTQNCAMLRALTSRIPDTSLRRSTSKVLDSFFYPKLCDAACFYPANTWYFPEEKHFHSFRQFLTQNCVMLRTFILRIPNTSLRWSTSIVLAIFGPKTAWCGVLLSREYLILP